LNTMPLNGLHVLVLEDEFLIAMDVEDLCREQGAASVSIVRNFNDLRAFADVRIDAAVLDVMLSGTPTFDFAKELREQNVPFVFATGHADDAQMFSEFSGVEVVGKPFAGPDLIRALEAAIASSRDIRLHSSP